MTREAGMVSEPLTPEALLRHGASGVEAAQSNFNATGGLFVGQDPASRHGKRSRAMTLGRS
jgi:hypothetical protein